MNSEVKKYFNALVAWEEELLLLREFALDSGLTEDFKWKHPCYTWKGKNIVLLQEFKDYCALLFPKGALLGDPGNLLIRQTANTEAARQLRFTNTEGIRKMEVAIRSLLQEAVRVEASGVKLSRKGPEDLEFPGELLQRFAESAALKGAFENLSPGRQKAYLLHFSQPVNSKTRLSRIERNTERILGGKGLNDCVCGLSRRMPQCDGSHRQLDKD